MKEFKVNDYITLKLEEDQTNIYFNYDLFEQCRYLFLKTSVDIIKLSENYPSIDELAQRLDESVEDNFHGKASISSETIFWAYCSNMQAWVDNEYNTRLLPANLAFPLLEKLTEVGDPIAKKKFKQEIIKRIKSGYFPVILYLSDMDYLDYLEIEELDSLFDDPESLLEEIFLSILETQEPLKKMEVLTILHRLSESGSTKAKYFFNQELLIVIQNGNLEEIVLLIEGDFLEYLGKKELTAIFSDLSTPLRKNIDQVLEEDKGDLMLKALNILTKFADLKIVNAEQYLKDIIKQKHRENNFQVVKLLDENGYLDIFGQLADEVPKIIKLKNLSARVLGYNYYNNPSDFLNLIECMLPTVKKCFSANLYVLKAFSSYHEDSVFLIVGAWNIAEAVEAVLNNAINKKDLEPLQEEYKTLDAIDLREEIEKDLMRTDGDCWNPLLIQSGDPFDNFPEDYYEYHDKSLINLLKNETEQQIYISEYLKRGLENYLQSERIIKARGIVINEKANEIQIDLLDYGNKIWVPKSAILLKKEHIRGKSYKYNDQNNLIDVIYEYEQFQTFIIDNKEIDLKLSVKKIEDKKKNQQEPAPIEMIIISSNSATVRLMLSYFEGIQLIFKGFTSCDEALKELQTNLSRVIIIDEILPDDKRSEFLRKIKSDERLKDITIRLFSKKSKETNRSGSKKSKKDSQRSTLGDVIDFLNFL